MTDCGRKDDDRGRAGQSIDGGREQCTRKYGRDEQDGAKFKEASIPSREEVRDVELVADVM
jgi:hypothetical protein